MKRFVVRDMPVHTKEKPKGLRDTIRDEDAEAFVTEVLANAVMSGRGREVVDITMVKYFWNLTRLELIMSTLHFHKFTILDMKEHPTSEGLFILKVGPKP